MAKLCKCGAIVDRRCLKCYPLTHNKTTKQRGYDSRWQRLSSRVRDEQPLCPLCLEDGIAKAGRHRHHIIAIHQDERLRLDSDNVVNLCIEHHEACEGNVELGLKAKRLALEQMSPGVG